MNIIDNLIKVFSHFFKIEKRGRNHREQSFKLLEVCDRASAISAAQQQGVATFIRSGNVYKWLFFTCPCGCKQQIALNLMQSHTPHWELEIHTPTKFTVYPSVDSTTCGAHFWLRDGKVIWCE